jgi:hypothetical protein
VEGGQGQQFRPLPATAKPADGRERCMPAARDLYASLGYAEELVEMVKPVAART